MVNIKLIEALKTLKTEQMDMDDMVALYSSAMSMKSTYESFKVPVPEFVTDAMGILDTEIKSKRRERLLRQRAILQAKEARLLSREEQRSKNSAELAEIESLLKE